MAIQRGNARLLNLTDLFAVGSGRIQVARSLPKRKAARQYVGPLSIYQSKTK